jgi:hypothetical protein
MTPREEKIKEGHNEKRKLERKIIMKKNLLKRITGCFLFVCALASLVATITLGIPATARAAAEGRRVCSVGMLKGEYLVSFNAYTNSGGNFVPTAVLQGLQFNGDGTTLNTFGTVNIGGTIVFDVTGAVGSYTVAPDCTGTLSVTGGPNFNIYVGPGAQKVWTIQSSPTPASTGVSVGTLIRLPGR